ncbi:hypothetical protein CVT26_002434 [Gymnopilus dilepis]|uniref:Secreted protein n=1 Tax=Gymnopilus dilepis TaxID=231916 RepID=A0A409Y3S9_9AGAR|nr:hypothetical protein CVT26_002434 [Gymnopilus dilepis]
MWRSRLLHAASLGLVPTPLDGGPQLPPPSRAHLHTLSPPLPLLVLLLVVDSGRRQSAWHLHIARRAPCCSMPEVSISVSGGEVMLL